MKRAEDYNSLIKRIIDSLNDPYSVTSFEDEHRFRDLMSEVKHDSITEWFDITQRLMKLLYKLKEENRNTDILDPGDLKIINKAIKDFGWSNQLKTGEFYADNLDQNSPYVMLSELHDIENGITNKVKREEKKVNKEIEKELRQKADSFVDEDIKRDYLKLTSEEYIHLARVMNQLRHVDNDMRSFIDENIDIYDLYAEYEKDEAQALKDIRDIKALSVRLDDILTGLDGDPALKRRRDPIIKEIIYKAISLGYTAGINANTTEKLREKGSNNSF